MGTSTINSLEKCTSWNCKDCAATDLHRQPLAPEGPSREKDDMCPVRTILDWSGQLDSNQRPAVPKTAALPGCAIPRHLENDVDTRLSQHHQDAGGWLNGR